MIEDLVEDYVEHVQVDYVGLWMIAATVRDTFELHDNRAVRDKTLEVVKGLLEQGLRPGDYLGGTDFTPWKEKDPAAILARIEREWNPANGDPDLGDSSCWFDMDPVHKKDDRA
ncbi:MAG TPA: hypothetical protein VKV77_08290 [Methylovirgula sp.]|nr:hypothetical protein [Methylovirgula sp.]